MGEVKTWCVEYNTTEGVKKAYVDADEWFNEAPGDETLIMYIDNKKVAMFPSYVSIMLAVDKSTTPDEPPTNNPLKEYVPYSPDPWIPITPPGTTVPGVGWPYIVTMGGCPACANSGICNCYRPQNHPVYVVKE